MLLHTGWLWNPAIGAAITIIVGYACSLGFGQEKVVCEDILLTVHSGECGRKENIELVVKYAARRIGNGIAMCGDEQLQEKLIKRGVGVEMCPSSNLLTKAATGWTSYPFKEFFDKGVLVSINRDNRTVTRTKRIIKRKKTANDNHLFPVTCYNVTMQKQDYYNELFELCQRDLAFIWLAKGQKPKRDAFYDFKGEKLEREVLDDLHYQFIRRLEKEGLITLKELFIDGTKLEANANRYTFVWRGSINYYLAGLLDTMDGLMELSDECCLCSDGST